MDRTKSNIPNIRKMFPTRDPGLSPATLRTFEYSVDRIHQHWDHPQLAVPGRRLTTFRYWELGLAQGLRKIGKEPAPLVWMVPSAHHANRTAERTPERLCLLHLGMLEPEARLTAREVRHLLGLAYTTARVWGLMNPAKPRARTDEEHAAMRAAIRARRADLGIPDCRTGSAKGLAPDDYDLDDRTGRPVPWWNARRVWGWCSVASPYSWTYARAAVLAHWSHTVRTANPHTVGRPGYEPEPPILDHRPGGGGVELRSKFRLLPPVDAVEATPEWFVALADQLPIPPHWVRWIERGKPLPGVGDPWVNARKIAPGTVRHGVPAGFRRLPPTALGARVVRDCPLWDGKRDSFELLAVDVAATYAGEKGVDVSLAPPERWQPGEKEVDAALARALTIRGATRTEAGVDRLAPTY